ncbi:MAG: hypothetical protein Q9218_002140 [Villophora microphyllina]
MTTPIPQPPGIPLVGNIFDVDPSNTWVSLQKLWEKYGENPARWFFILLAWTNIRTSGEIFKITVLGQQIVFVGSVALCEELCDEKRFRKYVGGPIVEIRKAVHASLFTAFANEPIWDVHHRILGPKMAPDAVAEHFKEICNISNELVAKWRDQGAGSTISPINELNRLDIETTTQCFYGRRLNNLTGAAHPMIAAMDGATGEAIKRPTRPKILNWLMYSGKFNRDCAAMRQYAADCLSYRKSHHDLSERKDLLYTMMNAKDPETGKALDEQQIIDEIVTMPIGSSTAPCAISSALYHLLRNPACITRARKEVDAILGPEGEFVHAHLDQLPYCTGIVREALRLSAAAPGFNIEPLPSSSSKDPILLAGGRYSVTATQTMIIVLHGVNRDPAVFPSPYSFQPERMMGEAFEGLPAGAKKWFGNGKRVCYGANYAFMWCVIVLVGLIRETDFEMVDEGYELKQDGWFNLRPVGFEVKVSPRKK